MVIFKIHDCNTASRLLYDRRSRTAVSSALPRCLPFPLPCYCRPRSASRLLFDHRSRSVSHPFTVDGNNPFPCLQPGSGRHRLLRVTNKTNLSPCLPTRSGPCHLRSSSLFFAKSSRHAFSLQTFQVSILSLMVPFPIPLLSPSSLSLCLPSPSGSSDTTALADGNQNSHLHALDSGRRLSRGENDVVIHHPRQAHLDYVVGANGCGGGLQRHSVATTISLL
ncbi:hypothetical protein ACLOJK_006125 [Asimina triloba]